MSVGELAASPESPDCDEPPLVALLLPVLLVLVEDEDEDEEPELPPAPVLEDCATLLESPPDPLAPCWVVPLTA